MISYICFFIAIFACSLNLSDEKEDFELYNIFSKSKTIFIFEYNGSHPLDKSEEIEVKSQISYIFSCKRKCKNFVSSEYYNWIKNLNETKNTNNIEYCKTGYIAYFDIKSNDNIYSKIYISASGRCAIINEKYYVGTMMYPSRDIIR